jgi:hypothetical protein
MNATKSREREIQKRERESEREREGKREREIKNYMDKKCLNDPDM